MGVTPKNVSVAQDDNEYSVKAMNKRPKPISLPPIGYSEFDPTEGGFSSPHERRANLIKALQKPIPGKIEAARIHKAHKRASMDLQDGPIILPEFSLSPTSQKPRRRSPSSSCPVRSDSPDQTKGIHKHSAWLNSHSEERFAKLEELQREQDNAERAPTTASAAKKLKAAWMKMKIVHGLGKRSSQQDAAGDMRRFSIKPEDFDPEVKAARITNFNQDVELIKSQSVSLLDRKTHFYKYGVPDASGSGEGVAKKQEGRTKSGIEDGAVANFSENQERRKRMAMYRYHRSMPRKVQPLRPFIARSDAPPKKKESCIVDRNASTKALHDQRMDVKHQKRVEANYHNAMKQHKYMSQWLASMDNHKNQAMYQWHNWEQRVAHVKKSRKDALKHNIKSQNSAHLKRQQLLGIKWITMIIAHKTMEGILRAEEQAGETHSTLESFDSDVLDRDADVIRDTVKAEGESKSPKSQALQSSLTAMTLGTAADGEQDVGTPDDETASPKKSLASQKTMATTVNRRSLKAARKQDKKKIEMARLLDAFRTDSSKFRRVLMLQFFLRAKILVKNKRESAVVVLDALKSWQKIGPSKLMFRRFSFMIKRIQLWWRRYSARMHNLRSVVSKQWRQMERHIVVEELRKPTKKKDHGHENRMELSLNERIEANMLPDPMRDQFIIHEMRFQRHALLGPIAVWKQQITQYYQDVQMWRSNRNARELMQDDCCSEDDGTMTPCPMMPGVPSHLPDDADLTNWIKQARRNSMGWRVIEQTNTRLNRRGTVDRFGRTQDDMMAQETDAAFVTQEDFFKDFK